MSEQEIVQSSLGEYLAGLKKRGAISDFKWDGGDTFEFVPVPQLDRITLRRDIEPELLTSFTTTNIEIKGEIEMTEEQQAELAEWWEDHWRRELERQIMDVPSEYAESLRAAKAQV
ncbi:hypothetical protein I6F34_01125 [Bradyrhizobium sp. BRP05]|nr:hypothetical protein [Bradyrhizobium sp. BRP05]